MQQELMAPVEIGVAELRKLALDEASTKQAKPAQGPKRVVAAQRDQ